MGVIAATMWAPNQVPFPSPHSYLQPPTSPTVTGPSPFLLSPHVEQSVKEISPSSCSRHFQQTFCQTLGLHCQWKRGESSLGLPCRAAASWGWKPCANCSRCWRWRYCGHWCRMLSNTNAILFNEVSAGKPGNSLGGSVLQGWPHAFAKGIEGGWVALWCMLCSTGKTKSNQT